MGETIQKEIDCIYRCLSIKSFCYLAALFVGTESGTQSWPVRLVEPDDSRDNPANGWKKGLSVQHGITASIELVRAACQNDIGQKEFLRIAAKLTALGRLCQDLDDVAGSFEMYQQHRQARKASVPPEIRSPSYIAALLIVEGSTTGGASGVQKGTKGCYDTPQDRCKCWQHPYPSMIYHGLDAS